jgi:hypothetical protein
MDMNSVMALEGTVTEFAFRKGWATVGHRGRRVIKPDVGGIEVWRIRARRWRKRQDQAVASATVGRTSAVASVGAAARNALTPFPSPVTAQRTLRGDVTPHLPWFDPSPRADRRDRLDLHQHPRIGQLVDGHVAQGWTRRRETAASRFGATVQGPGADIEPFPDAADDGNHLRPGIARVRDLRE